MRDISMARVNETRSDILCTITSKSLTHEQKITKMASLADSLLEVMHLPEGLAALMDKGIICDLSEGHAPVRPRYVTPDYEKLLRDGCAFLRLEPPKTLAQALNTLLIFYKHVPSVTNFPVYVGNLDTLLERFVVRETYEDAKESLRLFLNHMDRTITDSFCHANIGPCETTAGNILLELEKELDNAVPNFSFKYDPDITSDAFMKKGIETQLKVAKPSFANDKMFRKEFDGEYAIASCYNGLLIGGGAYTLVRFRLKCLAEESTSINDFFSNQLPNAIDIMLQYIDERIRFIVEDSHFFESNFLSKEGFISQDRFTGMLGVIGLAECVNVLLEKDGKTARFGSDKAADELGVKIIDTIFEANNQHYNPYCNQTGNHFLMHGQVGISTDAGQTPNCRIPIGEEPEEMADHILHCARFHPYFPSGIGEIFMIDETVHQNPEFEMDIIKGAFENNVRYLSMHASDSDLIRVTGYLAKKSEIENLEKGENVLHDTTMLGMGQKQHSNIYNRKIR